MFIVVLDILRLRFTKTEVNERFILVFMLAKQNQIRAVESQHGKLLVCLLNLVMLFSWM